MVNLGAIVQSNQSIVFRYSNSYLILLILLISSLVLGCTPLHLPAPTSTATVTRAPAATTALPPTLTPSPTSAIQLNQDHLQGISIRFWHPYSAAIGETWNQLADEFSLQNPWHIAVESYEISGIDLLQERVETAFEQGTAPTLIILPLYQALKWNREQPLLVDWSLYIEDVQWGLSPSEFQQYYPNLWEASLIKGHRWGIPARRVAHLLLYNASWARELGYPAAPKTLTEFQEQACSIPADGNQGDTPPARGYLFTHDYPTILGWFTAFGAQIEGSETQGYQFESPAVREAFVYLRQLYEQGCTLNITDLDRIEAFTQRKALFVPIHSGEVHEVEQAMQNAANRDLWTVLPYPTRNGEGSIMLYGTDFVLLRSSEEEQLAAWLFVRWLLEKENQQRLAEKTLSLPLRRDVVEILQNNSAVPAAYRAALEYLPMGHNEPMWASWDTVRWAVGDASRQLVAWYFTLDQVPSLVKLLAKTAADLHFQKP